MAYLPRIKPDLLHQLWVMKKYMAAGPITLQIQKALNIYLAEELKRIGMSSFEEIKKAIDEYDEQKRSNKKEPAQ